MNGIRVTIFALLVSVVHAETLAIVRGRVESDSAFIGNDLTAEMQDNSRSRPAYQSQVMGDGSFDFRDVSTGNYILRLLSAHGDVIAQQIVDVFGYTSQLSIRLPKTSSLTPARATVSVRELQRPVPEKAFRAFAAAQRDTSSGHELEAIRKLERALQIDPEYSDARCNLGVAYIHLKRYKDALEQFEKAVASGPPSATLYGNLSYALYALGRSEEAEKAARHAVALDSSCTRAHYLLGSILAREVKPSSLAKAPEAAWHLRLGAADIPRAHIEIAQMYMAEGDRLSAAEELRLYLKTQDTTERPTVERWLSQLPKN